MNAESPRPPKLAEWLLSHLTFRQDGFSLLGDFEEEFCEIAARKGIGSARKWYWRQAFRSLPTIIKDSILWGFTMFFNYLRIALRSILKRKGFSLINIAGLATGLACGVVIILYVANELSYDNYHPDAERIYRVALHRKSWVGEFKMVYTPAPVAPVLKAEYPQVQASARVIPPYENADHVLVTYKEKRFFENRVYFVDPSIFEILRIPFIHGNQETSLNSPYTIVINRAMAEKYFGDENPVGKILKIELDYDIRPVNIRDFKITGILKNPPVNTHFKYDMLISIATLNSNRPGLDKDWWDFHSKYTYIKLAAGVDVSAFEQQIQRVAKIFSDLYTKKTNRTHEFYRYFLQPVHRIHMHSRNMGELEPSGNWNYIYIYSVIALLILLIGCMNFMNLSAAQYTTRTREVGLRKVVGANRRNLVWQFLGESFLITMVAFMTALILISFLLPLFNEVAGTELGFLNLNQPGVILSLIGLLLLVSIGAGCYPAFILTSFKPVRIIQGDLSPSARGSQVQKLFVVGQFTISIFLVICTITVFRQLDFMKGRALGFIREQKIILRIKSNQNYFRRNYEAIKSGFMQHPNIVGATVSSSVPGEKISGGYYMRLKGDDKGKPKRLKVITMDFDFLSQYGIEMEAGRPFRREMGNDQAGAFLINESGIKQLGLQMPQEVIGKEFWAHYHRMTKKVVGVTRNFRFLGMHDEVEPLVMDIEPSLMRTITLSVNTENLGDTLSFVKKKWQEHFPGVPFEFSFLDQEFDRIYRHEEQMGKLLGIITFLGITIACLGLLGLASFITQLRRREIGIRKVLGASVKDIVRLMSKKFITLVFLASVISFPVAWYAMNQWLQDFAYRIQLGFLVFIISAGSALVIALVTISFQSFRAASYNPVDTLRSE